MFFSFCFNVFLWVVLFLLFYVSLWFLFLFIFSFLCFRLVCLSFCIYNRTNIYKQKHKQLEEQHDNRKTTEISQPEPDIYLFAVGSRAGHYVFMFCFYMFFFEFFCLFFWMFLYAYYYYYMFSPSLFKLLHLQSNNIYNNIQQTYKLEEKQNNRKTEVPGSIPIVLCSTKFVQFTRFIVTCSWLFEEMPYE